MADLPPVNERTLPAVLRRWRDQAPDRLAVSDRSRSLTYAELWERALARAAGLRTVVGDDRGRILLMLDNHLDMALSWAATALGGHVEVPVNINYRGDVLVHQVNDSQATVLVIEDRYLDQVVAVADRLKRLAHIVVRGSVPQDLVAGIPVTALADLDRFEPEEPADVVAGDPMAIMYTSGTTGVSKGVLVSHAHAYTYGSPDLLHCAREDDTEMVVLPLFHVGGQWAGLYNAWIAGAHAYVADRFDGKTFWDEAREHGCTYALLVGAMANYLMQQPVSPDDARNPFRCLMVAPVPDGIEDFAERFDVEIVTGYGSTEAGTVLVAGPGEVRSHSCGYPAPTVEVRIVDELDHEVADGEIGELLMRPKEPWITMLQYVGRPEATVEAWRNLWYHTGDAMFRDEDGQYIFVDRLGDAIRRRGENIPSAAVEGAINDDPEVLECAVVGVRGEIEHEVLAAVVPQPGHCIDPEALILSLAERLPHFMVPRYVRVVDELERTPSGKVRKRPLREAGVAPGTWDREAAGISVTRRGVERAHVGD